MTEHRLAAGGCVMRDYPLSPLENAESVLYASLGLIQFGHCSILLSGWICIPGAGEKPCRIPQRRDLGEKDEGQD